jgi:hypothetical protein
MPGLSLRDINQIILDVRSQEIIFSHLADELTDHICCDVEYEMGNGLSFNEAYRNVKEKIHDSMELSANYNRLETALDEIPAPASQTPVMYEIDDLLKIGESPRVWSLIYLSGPETNFKLLKAGL